MKHFKLYHVNITYRCNKNCSYCYAKDLKEDYNKDMSMEDFKCLLAWFKKNNIDYFNILGGEPTIHHSVGDMLALAKEKNFKVTLFTNGLFPEDFLKHVDYIHSFLVNYNAESTYTQSEYELLHNNLDCIKQKKKPITLAFNITDNIDSCDYVIEAVKKYGVKSVNVDFIIPNSLKTNEFISSRSFKENKDKMIRFLNNFRENGIHVRVTRPFPLCIFGDYIRKNKRILSSTCTVGYGVISINPDLSIFPCLSVFFKGPKITSFNNLQEVGSFYQDAITDVKWKRYLYPECKSCIYLTRKKCQGSCLCYKCAQFHVLNKSDYTVFSQYNLEDIGAFIREADKAVDSLNRIFGKPKQRFKVYLYNNKKDMLYYSGVNYYPDWVMGFASKNTYHQYQIKPGRIIHELCHIYTNHYKGGSVPLWLEEGFCEYLDHKDKNDSRLNNIMKEKKLIPFEELFERDKMCLLKYDADTLDKNIAYIQSQSLVSYIINKFGIDFVINLLKADYDDFMGYFEESTKQRFEDVKNGWLSSINGAF